jgi:hypothetical protein
MYQCPHQHSSTTPDFCSVCGVEILESFSTTSAAALPRQTPAPVPLGRGETCPDCGTVADRPGQVFCEACGYNFRARVSGDGPAPAPALPPLPCGVRHDLVMAVDPALNGEPNPDAPADLAPQTFTLFDRENLIGRGGADLRVQVPVQADPGVSRRHAVVTRRPDGAVVVRDLGSANGTAVNGRELKPQEEVALKPGDALGIGAWTRLTLVATEATP